MNQLHSAFTLFLSLLVEAMLFLLLGILFSLAIATIVGCVFSTQKDTWIKKSY
jgi:NADH:ubiquinone oxidoreductase subunit 6 (subunit J)